VGEPLLISADWGTSSFRAFLLGKNGAVLAKHTADMGIMKVPDRDFGGIFNRLLRDWLKTDPEIPVLMSGMIGSEQGWSLAPHIRLPAGIKNLSAALHPVQISNGRTGYIVPGLTTVGSTGVHDIIRGEETQIMGGLDDKMPAESVLCLPGTHSKWVALNNGVVTDFQTYLTGEALDVLTTHSIIGRLMTEPLVESGEAFIQGLARSGETGGLLHHLFGVRSQGFCGKIDKQDLKSYLAGILIGHEINGMKEFHSHPETVTIVAGKKISEIYEKAFDFFSIRSLRVDGESAAIRGHLRIAEFAGLTL
jgi:2-dehydro-3-deoxygalactonokinase